MTNRFCYDVAQTAVCRGRVTAAWNVYATLDDVLAAVRASPHEAPTLIDLAPRSWSSSSV